jgi:ankyrin repeat domain-containing protein 50
MLFCRFRWVVCQLDVLRKCMTVDALRRTLKALPKSLDETYDRILLNIDEQHSDQALKIMQWLAFSARPVTLEEVGEALTVDLDHGCMLEPDARLQDPHDILTICSSLVTVSSQGLLSDEDEEDQSVFNVLMRILIMNTDSQDRCSQTSSLFC